jgi:hypothetical protein
MSDHQDPIQSKRWINNRRSERVLLRVPIVVRGLVNSPNPIDEATHSLVVNANGALILLGTKVKLGQTLMVKNKVSGEFQECQVVHVGEQHAAKDEVGIAFTQPSPQFWQVKFPGAN